jgi:hypothetical protein
MRPRSINPDTLIARETITPSDPWTSALQKIRGQLGRAGVERIATDSVFETLDVPPFKRTPGAAKRLKGLMVELGCPPSGVARWTYAYRSRSVGGMRRVTLAGGTAAGRLCESRS